MIGDEVLFVADEATAAAEIALRMTERGADDQDRFPQVRAGMAHGAVVSRLGDVYGPVVNIAARLTSVARPGTVLVDRGAYEALSGRVPEEQEPDRAGRRGRGVLLPPDAPHAGEGLRAAPALGAAAALTPRVAPVEGPAATTVKRRRAPGGTLGA